MTTADVERAVKRLEELGYNYVNPKEFREILSSLKPTEGEDNRIWEAIAKLSGQVARLEERPLCPECLTNAQEPERSSGELPHDIHSCHCSKCKKERSSVSECKHSIYKNSGVYCCYKCGQAFENGETIPNEPTSQGQDPCEVETSSLSEASKPFWKGDGYVPTSQGLSETAGKTMATYSEHGVEIGTPSPSQDKTEMITLPKDVTEKWTKRNLYTDSLRDIICHDFEQAVFKALTNNSKS